MGLSSYTPTSVIAHTTSVDFSKRNISQPVHIVQYDKRLPILAVNIYNNGQLYPIPSDATVSIRFGKPDKTFVYNEAIGCDSTRTIVYFEITEQMTIYDGEFYPVIEILRDNKTANSSKIYIIVDRNPIQIGDIESTVEFKNLTEYRDEAKVAAEEAKKAATGVSEIKNKAEEAANNASKSEANSKASADNSAKSASDAKNFADNASTSATNAARSEANAKESEANASTKATEASTSATNAARSEANAKESANEAARLEQSVIDHKNTVTQLANNAEVSAKKSESWAVGGTSTRDGEDTNNSKWYSEQAKNYAQKAEAIAGGNFIPTSDKGVAGGVAVLDDNLAVAKAVSDEDGNNIKSTYAKKNEIPDGVKVDGKTITKDENGVLHGSSNITVDSALNNESENPVMNKVIAKSLQGKADKTDVPKLVKVDGKTITKDENDVLHGTATIEVDPMLNDTSENPIMNKAVFEALAEIEKDLKGIANDAVEEAETTSYELTNVKMLGWTVPRECPIQNEINGNQFIQKVGRIDLSDVTWLYRDESGHEKLLGKALDDMKIPSNNDYLPNIYTSVYETSTANNVYEHTKDKIISIDTTYCICVYDSSYMDAATFEQAMQGQYLYYELAIPITKTIDGNEISMSKADKTEVPKLVKVDGTTVFLSEDGVLSAKGGGGSSFAPKDVTNASITNGNGKVSITWTDPDDVTLEGITLSTWAGTKLVMNESNYPTNENDGTVVLDSKIRNQYQSTGYTVTGLTNNKIYYFALFPYSTDGIYNYSEAGRLLGKPSLVKLDPCTDMNATATMGKVTVTWSDPNATKTENGNTATWQKTVLVYKQGTTAPTDVNDGTIAVEETTRNQYQSTGYEVTSLIDGNDYSFSLFAISTDSAVSDATSVSAKLYATLTVTTEETSLYGKNVTVASDSQTVTGTFSNSGSVTLKIPWIGSTVVSSTDGTDTTTVTVNIAEYSKSYNAELSFLKIVTFADGTDEEIAAMIEAHYNNKINISDYWAVGDIREIGLSAMSATYVGESHLSGTYKFAIADFDHDDLTTPINGHTKAAVTLTQVDCLMDVETRNNPTTNGEANKERGYMNSSETNFGGWNQCARRTWCNDIYYNAIVGLKDIVKTVNKKTSHGGGSSVIATTADKVFLLSDIEVMGEAKYSFKGEGTQYPYYKSLANRCKLPKWDAAQASGVWFARSPYYGNSKYFMYVGPSGYINWINADTAHGIAPCFCL